MSENDDLTPGDDWLPDIDPSKVYTKDKGPFVTKPKRWREKIQRSKPKPVAETPKELSPTPTKAAASPSLASPKRKSATRTRSSPDDPDPKLLQWAEALSEYEDPFPSYDDQGRPIVASIQEITQTIAQWYVRKNNKYYDVAVPGEVLSRDDVERVITHRLRVEFPSNDNLVPDVVRQLLQKVIRDVFVSPRESIPIWSGIRKSFPGRPDKLIFSKHMTATINTWKMPAYRELGERSADWGPLEPFLDFMLPREDERNMVVNWLAWCLQNEGDKPLWALFLYSQTKGSGKSTLSKVFASLFGDENSSVENNVSKLVSRFNAPVLEKKFVTCEELSITPGSSEANAIKTYITETTTMTEQKGHDVHMVEQACAFLFTTNHTPLWLEQGDRRFYVVEVDHDGHRFGSQAEDFAKLSAEVHEYIKEPRNVAMLYNALMRHRIPASFSAKSLDVKHRSTEIMKSIQGASWDVNIELLDAELSRLGLVALPLHLFSDVVDGMGRPKSNQVKHWLLSLGWTREKAKWGGQNYARVIFLRPLYRLERGVLYGPGGWSKALGKSEAFAEYKRDDLHPQEG